MAEAARRGRRQTDGAAAGVGRRTSTASAGAAAPGGGAARCRALVSDTGGLAMKPRTLLARLLPLLLLAAAVPVAAQDAKPAAQARPETEKVRAAAERGLVFLEKEGLAWMQDRKCISCHHGPFMLWSHREALVPASREVRASGDIVDFTWEFTMSGGPSTQPPVPGLISLMQPATSRRRRSRSVPPTRYGGPDPEAGMCGCNAGASVRMDHHNLCPLPTGIRFCRSARGVLEANPDADETIQ